MSGSYPETRALHAPFLERYSANSKGPPRPLSVNPAEHVSWQSSPGAVPGPLGSRASVTPSGFGAPRGRHPSPRQPRAPRGSPPGALPGGGAPDPSPVLLTRGRPSGGGLSCASRSKRWQRGELYRRASPRAKKSESWHGLARAAIFGDCDFIFSIFATYLFLLFNNFCKNGHRNL